MKVKQDTSEKVISFELNQREMEYIIKTRSGHLRMVYRSIVTEKVLYLDLDSKVLEKCLKLRSIHLKEPTKKIIYIPVIVLIKNNILTKENEDEVPFLLY